MRVSKALIHTGYWSKSPLKIPGSGRGNRLWLWFSAKSLAISSSWSWTEFPPFGGSAPSCFEEIIGEHDQVTWAGAFTDAGTPIGTKAGDEGSNELSLEADVIGNGKGGAGGLSSGKSRRNLSICSLLPSSTGRSDGSSARREARSSLSIFTYALTIASFWASSSLNLKLPWSFRISSKALSSSFKTSIFRRSTSSSIFLLCISVACLSWDRAIVAFKVAISSSRPIRRCAKEMLLFPDLWDELLLLDLFDLRVEVERVELRSTSTASKSLILSPTCRRMALFSLANSSRFWSSFPISSSDSTTSSNASWALNNSRIRSSRTSQSRCNAGMSCCVITWHCKWFNCRRHDRFAEMKAFVSRRTLYSFPFSVWTLTLVPIAPLFSAWNNSSCRSAGGEDPTVNKGSIALTSSSFDELAIKFAVNDVEH